MQGGVIGRVSFIAPTLELIYVIESSKCCVDKKLIFKSNSVNKPHEILYRIPPMCVTARCLLQILRIQRVYLAKCTDNCLPKMKCFKNLFTYSHGIINELDY